MPGCASASQDAHHILNRSLFTGPDEQGGYYQANGAGLCETHHLDAEQTTISVEDLRTWCGITEPVIPEHLANDTAYDTWGNPVLPDGTRLAGELYYTEGCQKATAKYRYAYVERFKYPRTFHLPWSPGRGDDDKVQHDLSALNAADEVVVTEKQDGEATTIYSDGSSHARSVTTNPHPSRNHIRALAASVGPQLPTGWRICGENLMAVHSIEYESLEAHFQVYSIWDGPRCLPWQDTMEWSALLDLVTVPVIYTGPMLSATELTKMWKSHAGGRASEGYVTRPVGQFVLKDFSNCVLKYVRAEHVTTTQHWIHTASRSNRVSKP